MGRVDFSSTKKGGEVMRTIKAAVVLTMAFFLAVAMGPAADQSAYAGGGVDYEVTVKNDTAKEFIVWLYVSKYVNVQHEHQIIQPGVSYTFHTGALCPSGLWVRADLEADGFLYTVEAYYKLTGKLVMDSDSFTACCWNSSWRIVHEGKSVKVVKN